MSKSSLACCIKTVGSHSLRTADQYYQLGDIEESCSRREDALISYRKSRAIFENEHRTNTISYGIINSKVARLDIYYGRIADAENSLVKAISIFEQNRESCEPELSEAIELLSRCYEVADNIPELRKLSEQYDRQLHLIQDPLALEKVMKLVVQAKVKQTPKGLKDRALQLIDSLPLRFNQDNYIKGYESLRDILSKDRSLLRPLQHQFESLEDVLPEIKR
jgi:tetratricopeptide (TPR) repeat protein